MPLSVDSPPPSPSLLARVIILIVKKQGIVPLSKDSPSFFPLVWWNEL